MIRGTIALLLLCGCTTDSPTLPTASNMLRIDFASLPGADGQLGTTDDVPVPSCPSGSPECVVQTLSNEFGALGVEFVNWTVSFSDRRGHRAGYASGDVPTPRVRFTRPIYGITITSYSVWSLDLTIRDSAGTVLDTLALPHPNEGCLGRCDEVHGTAVVNSPTPIGSLVIRTIQPSPVVFNDGGSTFKHVALDDLVLTTTPP